MKFKLFIMFIIISSLLSSVLYSQTWEKISEMEMTEYIYSLQFDSFGNFYVASNNGLFCSTNRGLSWKNLYPTAGLYNYVSNVLPLGKNELLISAADRILYTNDRGMNWNSASPNFETNFLLSDNNGNIYAGRLGIYKSTDKGKTWHNLKDNIYIWYLYITAEGNMLAGTDCGIFLSTDNGLNWVRTGWFNCGDVTVIKGINNDEIIYIVGADRFRGIRYSTNGGYGWEYVSNSDTVRWGTSIIPINNNEIYFGSRFYGVFKYNKQDSSLSDVNNGLQNGVTAMAFDSLGYLYLASGGIYRSKNTLDSVKYLRNSVFSYSLAQNYPNPFNSNTTIEYSLETSGQVYISVFNLLGEKIAEILNEFKTKGSHQIVFDANSLASGIYFYQMKAGDFVKSKKMVLLR